MTGFQEILSFAQCNRMRPGTTARSCVWLVALTLVTVFGPMPSEGQQTYDIGSSNQIFLDGRFLAERENVRIVVQPPRKTGERNIVAGVHKMVAGEPIAVTDGPESSAYLQVMENDGVFRGFRYISKNGVDWQWATKELLDAGDFAYGMRDSVHPRLTAYGVVFRDPHAPPMSATRSSAAGGTRCSLQRSAGNGRQCMTTSYRRQLSIPTAWTARTLPSMTRRRVATWPMFA